MGKLKCIWMPFLTIIIKWIQIYYYVESIQYFNMYKNTLTAGKYTEWCIFFHTLSVKPNIKEISRSERIPHAGSYWLF